MGNSLPKVGITGDKNRSVNLKQIFDRIQLSDERVQTNPQKVAIQISCGLPCLKIIKDSGIKKAVTMDQMEKNSELLI